MNGRGGMERDRHHESKRRVIECNLVSRHGTGAQGTDHQSRRRKQGRFRQHGAADRQAQRQYFTKSHKVRPGRGSNDVVRRITRMPAQPDHKEDGHTPLGGRGGQTRAHRSQRRCAEMPVHQHPVEEHVNGQRHDRNDHHRTRSADAFTRTAQPVCTQQSR